VNSELIEEMVRKYRRLITDSLDWLEKNELKWKLDSPIEKSSFIIDLIERTVK